MDVTFIDRALGSGIPYITYAIPFFFLLIGLEFAAGLALHRDDYRLNDSLSDLGCGIADQVIGYMVAQARAGCRALQLFDTWAGILAPSDFDVWARPFAMRVLAEVRAAAPGVPLVYFVNGSGAILERLRGMGADMIGIDWKQDLAEARTRLGPALAVQGNLDPVALFAPVAEVEARVKAILEANRKQPGHVFNLGHGVLPGTPVESVKAMVAAVKQYG